MAMEEEGRRGVVPCRVHYRGMHFWNIPRTIFGIKSLSACEKGEGEPVGGSGTDGVFSRFSGATSRTNKH